MLLGNGDGTFQAAIPTNPGTTFNSVVVADVNGDGKPDILGLTETGTLFVLLGNGDGTFKQAQMFATVAGVQMMAGDFNGDGKLDVVILSSGFTAPGVVAVMLGNGDGTFQLPINSTGVVEPVSFSLGDINGDGKLDLVVADQSTSQTFTLLGNGDGTFQAPVLAESALGVVALADLNGDGKLDLTIAGVFANQIFLGNGDGTFGSERDYADYALENSNSFGSPIVVADFNNNPDIATTNASLLLGNGDGTFQAAPALVLGSALDEPAIGDFNGDGFPDIAGVFSPNQTPATLFILLNKSNGSFTLAHSYTLSQQAANVPIVTADFNGDGKLDLAIITSDPSGNSNWGLDVLLGNGDGSFGSPMVFAEGSGQPSQMAVADFNGDGKADLAVIDRSTSSLLVFLGNGDGTFSSPVSYFAGSGGAYLVTADFNGDGHFDVAVSGGANIAILLGKGDGTFQPATFFPAGSGPILVADLNGDGKPDLIANSPFQVFLGNGDGTFTPLSPDASNSLFATAVADFNGDGIPDVLEFNSVLLGNGDGTFGKPVTIFNSQLAANGGLAASFIAVADLNADTLPDIVLGSFSLGGPGGAVVSLLNTTPAIAPSIILTVASGSSNSATVATGATATYNLTIRGISGFSGTASLTCSGVPTDATCSVPASINVSATSNMPFTVTVGTTARTVAMLGPSRNSPPSWWAVSIFAIVCLPLVRSRNRLALPLRCAFSIVLILFLFSCGGGSSSSTNSNGTPAGTYTVTVTASSGSITTSSPLTLTVQ